MDLGPQTISVFITLFLILAAMGVALIVDLLKGNNEQLRELAIELKAKKDAAERHLESLETHTAALLQRPVLAAGAAPSQGLLPENTSTAESPAKTRSTAKPAPAPGAAAEPPRTEPSRTEEAGFQQAVRKGRTEQAPKREMSPAVAAVAQSVAARMAAGKMQPATTPVPVAEPAVAATPAPPTPAAPPPPEIVVPVPTFAAPATAAAGLNPEIVSLDIKTGIFQAPAEARKDWSRILTNRKHDSPMLAEETAAPAPPEPAGPTLPYGFHDYAILRKAAAAGVSMQGMVVAIGMNQLDPQKMTEVSEFVQSLLEAEDFGCQSGSDEFVLVCPGDGQTAQRRLSAIAEKLWDFQLRSMGRLNVQFAWGGMEARLTEKLNDAVASAIDQMTETRRARRGSSAQIARAV